MIQRVKDLYSKFKEVVFRDTSGHNEPQKVIVMIRILLLTQIVYFILNLLMCVWMFAYWQSLLLFVLFLSTSFYMFYLSYKGKTVMSLWLYIASTAIWVVMYIHFLGWNTGVQHYLMILLVLYFFSTYKNYFGKILLALGVVIYRLLLFNFYYSRTPEFVLLSSEVELLQTMNTLVIFWSVSVICFICSESGQELEGKLMEYNSMLEKQASTDALTGLYNRRKGRALLVEIAEDKQRASGCFVSIADIDFFKKVNDTYGHDAGDEVLKTLSGIFAEEMQKKNYVARWGGEEFLFVFENCSAGEARFRLESLRERVRTTVIECGEHKISVTMTFGLSKFKTADGLDATLKEADEKLYQGKEKGRNRIIY